MKTTKPKKHSYTSYAWEGTKYQRSLDIKEIAKRIRKDVKEKYPKIKLSVTIKRYSGGQSITASIMEAPFKAFTQENAKSLPVHMNYIKSIKREWKRCIKEGHTQVNQYNIESDYMLSEKIKKVLQDIKDITTRYNYDDSNAMIDYFDTNFYFKLQIGKWNKPFKQIS